MLADRVKEWTVEWEAEGMQKGMRKGRQEGMQKGRQEGIQKGRQEGMQKGIQKGISELLHNLLIEKFGSISPKFDVKLKQADNEQLLQWSKRILTANSPGDIFDQ